LTFKTDIVGARCEFKLSPQSLKAEAANQGGCVVTIFVAGALHLSLPDGAPWILAEWVSGPDILVRLERTRSGGVV
jgi:hypothetical protein